MTNAYSIFFYPLLSSYSFAIPYSNVIVLLFSSFSCQAAIIFVKIGYLAYIIESLGQTVSCGSLFLILQFKEFLYSWISISDCMIGSIFYLTTGLHGTHVLVGLIMFIVQLFVMID
jgi:heme/copper-type cytochrome/quinol oxidase subunit 3